MNRLRNYYLHNFFIFLMDLFLCLPLITKLKKEFKTDDIWKKCYQRSIVKYTLFICSPLSILLKSRRQGWVWGCCVNGCFLLGGGGLKLLGCV